LRWYSILFLIAVICTIFVHEPQQAGAQASAPDIVLKDWQVATIADGSTSDSPSPEGSWLQSGIGRPLTPRPKGADGIWVRIALPATSDWQRPGLLIERLYGHQLAVYQGGQLLHESERDFAFDLNRLLLTVPPSSEPSDIYIRILSSSDRIGLISSIRIGDFEQLSALVARHDLPDLLLGGSVAFLGLMMLFCAGYLNRRQQGPWISLSFVALSAGTLIIVYSPFPYLAFKAYGEQLLLLFDLSLFVLFPALHAYINHVFREQYRLFSQFGRFLMHYATLCLFIAVLHHMTGQRFVQLYDLITTTVFGVLILLQMVMILGYTIYHARTKGPNSFLLSLGLILLAVSGAADLLLYYTSEMRYLLFLWKFGVVALIITLVMILARSIMADYAKLVSYSKELELFNANLQRAEKMQIISDLAASVAHEVRNPLQVTRGFLQLMEKKSDDANRHYFGMAINELDRASSIITDFLTFAKPELESITRIDLAEEMHQIEAIMTPLASLHGGILVMDVEERLYIQGNSSKFKQAFINFIKNSIEALREDGKIEIYAYAKEEEAVIHVTDNGEGMNEEEIAKLGVPFYSTKSKGTGLGLMVTFRIIEAMQGTIDFKSSKGKGTEVIVRFPLALQDDDAV